MHMHWLKMFERFCVSPPKPSHPCTVSLLGVPEFSAFPPVLPSSTTARTPLTGIRLNPCATPLWGGPSGHLPIRLQTQVMSPSSASTSAASIRGSTFRPERAASTCGMTRQSPPQRILTFLNLHEQASAGIR